MECSQDFKQTLNEALQVLRAGGVILYPTDTVWGIGCDATNPEAVAKVYESNAVLTASRLCSLRVIWTW